MTTAFQEDLISSDFQALNLDFLIEILDIRRDILNDKDKDHRLKLAGNMKRGTSIQYPAGPDNDVRNKADKAIVQKVFEMFVLKIPCDHSIL